MGVNPCCCLNLRTGAFLIGVLEIVMWSISLTTAGLALIVLIQARRLLANSSINIGNGATTPAPTQAQALEQKKNADAINNIFLITILAMVLSVIRILNGSVLLLGVQRSSLMLVKTWLGVKILVVALTVGFFGTSIAMGVTTVGSNIFYGLSLIASAYFIWTILALIGAMKAENEKRPVKFRQF